MRLRRAVLRRGRSPSVTVLWVAAGVVFFPGCAPESAPSDGDPGSTDTAAPAALEAPATFRGTIPCADCPGIDLTVTLFPDGTYRLRRVYLERGPDATWHDLGRWSDDGDGRLALRGGGDAPQWFARFAWDSLRVLDGEGRAITSGLPFGLARTNDVDLVEDVQSLRGMMTYMADAARFTECRSGASFALATEGAYLSLERAYLDARSAPGEPLLVAVRGRLAVHPGMEGGPVPTLFVDGFEGAFPGVGCGGTEAEAALEGMEWSLVEVAGGAPVPMEADASLVLEPTEGRASGSSGCNRFIATYTLAGGRLTFGMEALTPRACSDPLMALERDYMEALRLTGSYRLVGGELELLGEAGPVARFRPR